MTSEVPDCIKIMNRPGRLLLTIAINIMNKIAFGMFPITSDTPLWEEKSRFMTQKGLFGIETFFLVTPSLILHDLTSVYITIIH